MNRGSKLEAQQNSPNPQRQGRDICISFFPTQLGGTFPSLDFKRSRVPTMKHRSRGSPEHKLEKSQSPRPSSTTLKHQRESQIAACRWTSQLAAVVSRDDLGDALQVVVVRGGDVGHVGEPGTDLHCAHRDQVQRPLEPRPSPARGRRHRRAGLLGPRRAVVPRRRRHSDRAVLARAAPARNLSSLSKNAHTHTHTHTPLVSAKQTYSGAREPVAPRQRLRQTQSSESQSVRAVRFHDVESQSVRVVRLSLLLSRRTFARSPRCPPCATDSAAARPVVASRKNQLNCF